MINGGRPENTMFEYALKRCYEEVAKDPSLCINYDIESGFPSVWTIRERDAFLDFLDSLRPKCLPPINMGKIIIFGTGGRMNDKHDFYKIYGENNV